MRILRPLLSVTVASALVFGISAPAFAYREATPPLSTTRLRRGRFVIASSPATLRNVIGEEHFAYSMERSEPEKSMTGHRLLARAHVRTAQNNFRRHILGYLRGGRYRILNTNGRGFMTALERQRRAMEEGESHLPPSLVRTGDNRRSGTNGRWGWDRPSRRDITENGHFGCVRNRARDILAEVERGETC